MVRIVNTRQGVWLVYHPSPIATDSALQSIIASAHESKSSFIEHVRIEIFGNQLKFTTGPYAVFPFYVWVQSGRVGFSWRLEDAIIDGHKEMEPAVALRFVNCLERYETKTLLKNVYQLTERAEIKVTEGDLSISLPFDYRAPCPQAIRSNEEAIRAFIDVLDYAASSMVEKNSYVELSGGRDSSLIALLPSSKGKTSYGIIFDGMAGQNQTARRNRIVEQQGLQDKSLVGLQEVRDGTVVIPPYGSPLLDTYGPLTSECLKRSGADQHDILTGIGGDEVMSQEVPLQSAQGATETPSMFGGMPKSVLPETGLLAACSRFEFFQQCDAWPVYPYMHPEVLNFMARLPLRLSGSRRIQMAALSMFGFSSTAMRKDPPENFVSIHEEVLKSMTPFGRHERSDDPSASSQLRQVRLENYAQHWNLDVSYCR